MNKIAQIIIHGYQILFSNENSIYHRLGFRKRNVCAFYPSCSEYSYEAFGKYSFIKALKLTIKRISRCHPWQKEHFDPLP